MSKLAIHGGEKVRTKPFPSSPVITKEERKHVSDVLNSGVLSGFIASKGEAFLGGPKVRLLESLFEKYFGVKYAVSVNSATAGLHTAIAAAGVEPGDEVIVSPYTMTASAAAILMTNAIPVFADITPDTFCLDPKSIEKNITPRTKAIVVVHLFGQSADMAEIMKIARKHKLKVIEDAAQAPGATYKKKFVGTIGDAGIFSLNQHKTITSGEGGVLVTNNKKIAEKARLIRNHGEVIVQQMNLKDICNTLGWNYRMTELDAAVAVAQFQKLDRLTKHRLGLVEELLKGLKKLDLPGLTLPEVRAHNKHVYFAVPFKVDAKTFGMTSQDLAAALRAEGIPFGAGYVQPIYWQPMYQKKIVYGTKGCPYTCGCYKGNVSYERGICPVAERMHTHELISTGICQYPVTKKDIQDVVKAFEKIKNSL